MSTASDFVANLQKLSFFCLETKERNKEKFKTDFFLLLTPFTTLKGRNSLRSNNLPFLTLRYGCSLNREKSRSENLSACKPMQQTRRKGIGLVFPALSAGVCSSVKKGRLFERSEFLPFSRREHRSSRKNAALNFLWFFLCFKTKKER